MEINIDDYDIDALRDYLTDYFGTASINASIFAMSDLISLDNKSDYEVLLMAINMGININNFTIHKRY